MSGPADRLPDSSSDEELTVVLPPVGQATGAVGAGVTGGSDPTVGVGTPDRAAAPGPTANPAVSGAPATEAPASAPATNAPAPAPATKAPAPGSATEASAPAPATKASLAAAAIDPPAAVPMADAPAATGSIARHSAIMAAGSVVSRITGFLRTAAVGAAIGAAAVADDYNLAITLPNMVFELLVGGVLASVVVPVLVRARRRDPDGGEAYTQRLLTLAAIFLAAATAVAVAAAPLFAAVLTRSRPDESLVTRLGYLVLPAIFFYGMAALFGAVLNTRGHFAAPMWTPILNNLVVIATAGVLIAIGTGLPTPESITTTQVLVLGIGTTLGIVVQACGLWPALRRVRFRWRWRFDVRALGLGELARMGAWMLLFVFVSQAGLLVVLKLAKLAGERAGPGPAIFQNAFLIFMMAHGIVAVSIITALMPRMSAAAADERHRDLVANLSTGIRLSAVVLVPTTAAYLVLGRPLAVTLFEWGNYGHARALATGTVIAVAGLGLVPYAVMQLQQFAFYALRDTRTPALINIPVVLLRVGIDIAFYLVLPAAAVAAALMGGSAISFVVGALLSFAYLRRRLGRLGMGQVVATLVRLTIAAGLAAVPALLAVYGLQRAMGDDKLASAAQLVAGAVVLVGCYAATALALRVHEVHELVGTVRARLGR